MRKGDFSTMTKKTLDAIHDCYVEAVKSSKDILDIARRFYRLLSALEVPKADQSQFDVFVDGVLDCVTTRERTSDMSTLLENVVTVLQYIVIFMNSKKGKNWDVVFIGGRKSLEDHLTKNLAKALQNERSARIRDLFRAKMVLNTTSTSSEKEINEVLHEINNSVIGILCGTNRALCIEFENFINSLDEPLVTHNILFILSLNFECESFKDYILHPKKENGYQTIQFTIRANYVFKYFGGQPIELQIRSKEMDFNAEDPDGIWSHTKYKNKHYGVARPIFHIPDELFSELNVAWFSGYGPRDTDGIGSSKSIKVRRMSTNLVPHYNQ